MNKPFKKSKKIISVFLITLFCINSCQSQSEYDPELMKPDNDDMGVNHGFTLTPLGCFLYFPWEYEIVTVDTLIDKGLYNGRTIKEIKQDFVFEPQKDGSLKYWFKSDYLVSPIDTITLADGNKSIEITRQKSEDLKIKRIYTSGRWEANFKDSIISIDFGKNDFGLKPIKGKYYLLTAAYLRIAEEVDVDSIFEGEQKKIKKKRFNCFLH